MGSPTTIDQLPPNVVNMVTQQVAAQNAAGAAANPNAYPMDPNIVLGIVAVESSGNPAAINYNYNVKGDPSSGIKSIDYGLMQLNSLSHPNASASMPQTQNVSLGVAEYYQKLQTSGGDNTLALEKYNGSVGDPTYANKVLTSAGNVAATSNSDVLSGSEEGTISLSPTATAYTPLPDNGGNANIITPLIVINDGLDAVPWYQDQGLITGNPRLRQEVQPVNFQVLLHDNNYFVLSSQGASGVPINIQLNASMKSINWTMKHNYHHQRTRTAHHITFWGMNADTIEGTCTTGVFMNQFGLTDYYSTRTVNDNLKTLVTNGMMFGEASSATNPTPAGMVLGSDGKYYPATSVGTGGSIASGATGVAAFDSDSQFQSIMNAGGFDQTSAFRVAAQDAFAEFLALFKMNGSVWFWNQLWSTEVGDSRDWAQIDAWSPKLGVNSTQANARNNDVVTRGGVIMSYRNYTFQGYFKSLQWTMDASNPFQWNFSFVFQVERTIGTEFLPS